MKNLTIYFLLGCLLCLSKAAEAQIVTAQSGAWDASTTWVGGSVPGNQDRVRILSGHTVTGPTQLYTAQCKTLTIDAGAKLDFIQNTISVHDTLLAHGKFLTDELLFGDMSSTVVPGYVLAADSFYITMPWNTNYMGDFSVYNTLGTTFDFSSNWVQLGDLFLDEASMDFRRIGSTSGGLWFANIYMFSPLMTSGGRHLNIEGSIDLSMYVLAGGARTDSMLADADVNITFYGDNNFFIDKDSLYLNFQGHTTFYNNSDSVIIASNSFEDVGYVFGSLENQASTKWVNSGEKILIKDYTSYLLYDMDIRNNDVYIDTNGTSDIYYVFLVAPWVGLYSSDQGRLWYYLAPDTDPTQLGQTDYRYYIPLKYSENDAGVALNVRNDGVGDWFSFRIDSGLQLGGTTGSYFTDSVGDFVVYIEELNPGGSLMDLEILLSEYDTLPGTDFNACGVMHYTNGAWDNDSIGVAQHFSFMDLYGIRRRGISSFSPFGFGSIYAPGNSNLALQSLQLNLKDRTLGLQISEDINMSDLRLDYSTNLQDWEVYTSSIERELLELPRSQPSGYFRLVLEDGHTVLYSNVVNYQLDVGAVSVFPNPSSGILHISSATYPVRVRVQDMYGRIVREELLESVLDISDLSSGMYTVSIFYKEILKNTVQVIKE